MPDYIKRSPDLHKWLLAQGIKTYEHYTTCDPYSPVVVRAKLNPFDESGAPEYCKDSFEIMLRGDSCDANYVCPYFGPGGEGNLLKALRALEEHLMGKLWQTTGRACHYAEARAWWFVRGDIAKVIGNGKTDGLALAELLWKIKEASE